MTLPLTQGGVEINNAPHDDSRSLLKIKIKKEEIYENKEF